MEFNALKFSFVVVAVAMFKRIFYDDICSGGGAGWQCSCIIHKTEKKNVSKQSYVHDINQVTAHLKTIKKGIKL